MRIRRKPSDEGDIVQMGPLIDCVFLLLIFFMVTTTLSKLHRELGLELPNSTASIETKSKPSTLVVELTKDGTIFLEGEQMNKTLLHQRLRAAKEAAPDRQVRIDADRRTAAQHLVYLMDLLQFEGLKNVGIRTKDLQGLIIEKE